MGALKLVTIIVDGVLLSIVQTYRCPFLLKYAFIYNILFINDCLVLAMHK